MEEVDERPFIEIKETKEIYESIIGEKGCFLKIRKRFDTLTEWGLNLLYPHRCPVCHEILENQRDLICPGCSQTLKPIKEPRCKKCGRPVLEEAETCRDCGCESRSFLEGRGIYLYTEIMRKSVVLYKYEGRREYAVFFATAMSHYAREELRRWKPDLIVPIPLHKRKLRRRGFNQSMLLAELLGRQLGIGVSEQVLVKRVKTKSQKKLDAEARRRNLKKAFSVVQSVKGLRILLIDDVFTTGSTIDAAAECLRKAGASEVFFLTLCIASE